MILIKKFIFLTFLALIAINLFTITSVKAEKVPDQKQKLLMKDYYDYTPGYVPPVDNAYDEAPDWKFGETQLVASDQLDDTTANRTYYSGYSVYPPCAYRSSIKDETYNQWLHTEDHVHFYYYDTKTGHRMQTTWGTWEHAYKIPEMYFGPYYPTTTPSSGQAFNPRIIHSFYVDYAVFTDIDGAKSDNINLTIKTNPPDAGKVSGMDTETKSGTSITLTLPKNRAGKAIFTDIKAVANSGNKFTNWTFESGKDAGGSFNLSSSDAQSLTLDNDAVLVANFNGASPINPPDTGGGQIIFIPNETSWTFDSNKKPGWSNSGKINNGSGDYPVTVKYVGNNPVVLQGTATFHHSSKKSSYDYTETFDVKYSIKNIIVSGDVSKTVDGAIGNVDITKEGANLKLHGEGTWNPPQYTIPSSSDSLVGTFIPPEPKHPIGDSSTYKLDWTNPTMSFSVQPGIFSTDRNAVRKPSKKGKDDAFYATLAFKDNLSGCKELKYGWTFGNNPSKASYETIYTSDYTDNDRSSETLTREIEKPVGDDLYMHVKLVDMAGNETDKTFGPYEDPIKLKNFRVIDVTDPTWENVFWKDGTNYSEKNSKRPGLSQPTGKEFKANELPVDSDSNPYGTYAKKGYAFYFKVDSEYLYRDYDRIEVTPTFYYWDGKTRKQVDAYYNKDNNPFIKVGGDQDTFKINSYATAVSPHGNVELGGYNKLTLTKAVRDFKGRPFYNGWKGQIQYTDGKEQYWYGQYYLPDSTIFTQKGKPPVPTNVLKKNYIIINFQLKAYKNGSETNSSSQTFTYVPNQWQVENGPKSTKYNPGDVMVYDNKYAIYNNWESYITN